MKTATAAAATTTVKATEKNRRERRRRNNISNEKDFVGNVGYMAFLRLCLKRYTAESRGKQWILAQHNGVSASFRVSYFWKKTTKFDGLYKYAPRKK